MTLHLTRPSLALRSPTRPRATGRASATALAALPRFVERMRDSFIETTGAVRPAPPAVRSPSPRQATQEVLVCLRATLHR